VATEQAIDFLTATRPLERENQTWWDSGAFLRVAACGGYGAGDPGDSSAREKQA
jgi:hypothetical protein